MSQESFHDLKLQFGEALGFKAEAKITLPFALRSADVIYDIEEKLQTGQTHPTDLYRATIAASQLLMWHDQIQTGLTNPAREAQDAGKPTLPQIEQALSQGQLAPDRFRALITNQYVQNSPMGVRRGIEAFFMLRGIYPNLPLFATDIRNSPDASAMGDTTS